MKNSTFCHAKRMTNNHPISTTTTGQRVYTLRDALRETTPLIWGMLFSIIPIILAAFLTWVFSSSSIDFLADLLQSPDILIVGITIYVSYISAKKTLGTNFVLLNTIVVFVGMVFYVCYYVVPYVGQFNIPTSFTMVFNPCYCLAELAICFIYTYYSNRKTQ